MATRTRRRFTDADKARVYAELEVNEGNVKRTARHTGVSIGTVRRWKQQWEREGIQPDVAEALPAVIGDFVERAEGVQWKLLVLLESRVDQNDISTREIVPALGMLTDKIRAYRNLDKIHQHVHTVDVPQLDHIQEQLGTALSELVAAGNRRQQEIDDVLELEPSQYKELEPATEA